MEKDSPIKMPTTFSEQIELLKSRNLNIEDAEFAERALKRINYYRLSAYMLTLKTDNEFIEGATFKQLLTIYEVDRKLRQLLMETLENIEIAFRTHIAYLIAHKYGTLGYENQANFLDETWHAQFLSELERAFAARRKSELFIEHHYHKYSGKFPIWVATEVTSFGTLSKLYKNLKVNDKKEIAKTYYNVPYTYIESWLRTLSNVRNACAHFGRLYNKDLTFRPMLFNNEKKLISNKKVFAAIYVAKRLLTKQEVDRLLTALEALIDEYEEQIDLSCLGFKSNWKQLLRGRK
ncbi:Abi family protein [Virgibacillus dakarensis]|uniref:Abi family protein n=1 Tax=Virgibacillus dakarensis TaxID=1917889 RepID=UPI000B4526C7|nr:Abi family protein [Virgibacillus dakarensis]